MYTYIVHVQCIENEKILLNPNPGSNIFFLFISAFRQDFIDTTIPSSHNRNSRIFQLAWRR